MFEHPHNAGESSRNLATVMVETILGPLFVALAAWFMFASPAAPIPAPPAAGVPPTELVPGGRRLAMGEPPATTVGGFSHRCNDCHRLFKSPPTLPAPGTPERRLMQHVQIILRHGLNNRCFNCHDQRDREQLVLMDGSTVSFAQAARQCADCHGPVYRDWERGTHGKTLGSWNAAGGLQRRLRCNECHDPHAPAYEPMRPLPGPNTLRMGPQEIWLEPSGRHVPTLRPETRRDPAGPPPAHGMTPNPTTPARPAPPAPPHDPTRKEVRR